MKLLIILILFPYLSVAQTTFSGTISKKSNKEKIPFATIGLVKENIGTNAEEDGGFILKSINSNPNDTLIISSAGYKTHKIPVDKNLFASINIELLEDEMTLNEVVVTNKKFWTSSTLNDFAKCGNSFVGSSGFQTQLAQHFKTTNENTILTEIRICRMSSDLFGKEKTIFRIRIYDIDTITKGPSTDLCYQIIEVKAKRKFINLNLEQYNIRIPNRDFFVAIEWLKIPYNENRQKINGKEVEDISYSPSIGWTDNTNSKMEAWRLDYRNIWQPMFKMGDKTSVSISATVKY